MKKIIILIVLIFFKNVISQNNNLGQNKKNNNPSLNNARLTGQGYQQTQSLIALYDSVYNWHLDTTTMQWIYTNKTTNYVYNAQQAQISYLTQKWNGTTWVNSVLDSNFYNANSNISSQLKLRWNGTTWIDSVQTITTHDSILQQNWNGSVWANYSLEDFTFDNHHNATSVNTYTWNSTAWVKTQGFTYSYIYDTNNDITSEEMQVWVPSGSPPPFLDTYTYNSNKYITTHLSQIYYPNLYNWVNQIYVDYHYINNTELDSEIVQTWQGTSNGGSGAGSGGYWGLSSLNVYTYDGNSNRLTNLGQTYTGAPWTNSYLYTYTYDANNIEKSYTIKHFNNTGAKVTSGDSTVYYFNAVTAIKQIAANNKQIKIYPNPANNKISVDATEVIDIKLFDVVGKQIASTKTNNVDVSNLINGVYFIQVQTKQSTTTQKIIVQH